MTSPVRRIVRRVVRWPGVGRALRALAGARGHRLVLVYHRIGPPAAPGCEVVPSVPVDLFRAQLGALGEVADLVPLDDILQPGGQARDGCRRPAVAVTLDDDLSSHAIHALRVLREMGVPATFFLSGRALHGLGPYWFQQLEILLADLGRERVAALLGVETSQTDRLAAACEQRADLRQRVAALAETAPAADLLTREGLVSLTAGGMAVGFHTVHHEVLPELSDAALEEAVSHGRDALAAATGSPVRHFAYPYGKADLRAAAAVRRAGFRAGFTGRPSPVRHADDQYRLGRWEPGGLSVDDLLVSLSVRLHRVTPAAGPAPDERAW